MKAQTKAIIASVVVIALALTAVSGVTYSWWSDTENSTINITTGNLEVSTSEYSVTGTSLKADGPVGADQLPSIITLGISDGTSTSSSDGRTIMISDSADCNSLELSISYKVNFTASIPYRYVIDVNIPAGVFATITVDGAPASLPMEVEGTGTIDTPHVVSVSINGVSPGVDSSIQFTNYITQRANTSPIISIVDGSADISSSVSSPATITGTVVSSGTPETVSVEASFDNVPANAKSFEITSSKDPSNGVTTLNLGIKDEGGIPITETGKVLIKVELEGNVNNPQVIFNGDDGDQPTLKGSSYDPSTHKTTVMFETNHFSQYLIFDSKSVLPVSDETLLHILASNRVSCKLSDDIVITSPIIAKGVLTLDLNGYKIYNTVDIWNESTGDWSLLSVRGSDTVLTIKGSGSLDSNENDCYAIDVRDGATCSVYGDADYIGNVDSVYVYEGILKINGGSFSIKQLDATKPYDFVINCYDSSYKDGTAQVYITGGTFEMFNPAANGAESSPGGTNFLDEGCSVTMTTKEGKDYYTVFNDFDEALASAISVSSPIYLGKGDYSIVGKAIPKSFTVLGSGMNKTKVIVDEVNASGQTVGPSNVITDGCFKDVCLSYTNENYHGFQHSNNVVYERCMIEGQPFLYSTTTSFKDCTFVQTSNGAYNVWTYGAGTVTFDGCIFNSAGKAILIYIEGNVNQTINIKDCVLNASEPVEGKAAVEVDSQYLTTGSFSINIENTTSNGFDNGSVSGNTLWNEKKGNRSTITVDGVVVRAPSS